MKRRIAKHGTLARYTNHSCRCTRCKKVAREYMKELRVKLRATPANEIPHGLGGYTNYGCRCSICTKAKAKSRAAKVTA